jgi:TRAP-type C4-dicarboxylate transport system substrate-binding protein
MSGIARFVLVLAWLCASVFPAAAAEPIKLKLAYFSSDRTTTYLATIKPFVDAVNAEAADLLEIEVHFSGALGKDPRQQLQLVLDDAADIAFIAPGYTPERFPDNTLVELPGMFRGIRDATLVYTRLVAANALRGYEDLFVIGAFATEPESIHAKVQAGSLDDLQGKRIRANNPVQAAALARLGMQPVQMPINQIPAALNADKIDGALVGPAPMVEFGISRVAANHYLLGVASAPLAVVMKRATLERLPERAQRIIRKFSGEWTAERYVATYLAENKQAIQQLSADANRKVVSPSAADRTRAGAAFQAETDKWLDANPRNPDLLKKAKAELERLDGGTTGGR